MLACLKAWVEGEVEKKKEGGSITCEKERNKERPHVYED